MSHRYYPALDGLRGVAALAVVLFHAFIHSGLQIFPRGYLAVDFFYVLSGFVIYDAYGTRLMSAPRFLLQRGIRLYPTILLSTILVAILGVGRVDLATLIRQALVIPNLTTHVAFPENPPLWSMASEILANIVFFGTLRSASVRAVALLCIIGLSCLIGCVYRTHTLDFGAEASTFLPGLSRIAFFFPAGILIHHAASRVRLPAWPLPATLLLLLLALSVPHIAHADALLDLGLACLVLPVCVAVSLTDEVGHATLSGCRNLGLLSYPLYLVHWPLLQMFEPGFDASASTRAILCIACIVAGICATWLYDKPVRRWLARTIKRQAHIPVHAR